MAWLFLPANNFTLLCNSKCATLSVAPPTAMQLHLLLSNLFFILGGASWGCSQIQWISYKAVVVSAPCYLHASLPGGDSVAGEWGLLLLQVHSICIWNLQRSSRPLASEVSACSSLQNESSRPRWCNRYFNGRCYRLVGAIVPWDAGPTALHTGWAVLPVL